MIGDGDGGDEYGAMMISQAFADDGNGSDPYGWGGSGGGWVRGDGNWHAAVITHYQEKYEIPILSAALLFNEPCQVLA
jgi:hypothetical protein